MTKQIRIALALLFCALSATAQQKDDIHYVDNEECGCSLAYVNGIQTTQSGRRFGFKLADGTQIVPNKYMFVDRFHDGFCKVWLDYGEAGLIDSTGREIVPCIFDEVFFPSEGMIVVIKDERMGYYNTRGQSVIPCQYPAASDFHQGLAAVAVPIDSVEASFGYIDTTGRLVIQPQYQFAQPFSEGYASVQQYGSWGVIDTTGKIVLPIKYQKLSPVIHGRLFAGFENEIAMFDEHFKPITKFVYSRVDHEGDGLFLVQRDGKFGFLNRQGKEVIKCQFDLAGGFNEGFSWVMRSDKYGIINTKGKYLIPLKYENNTRSLGLYSFNEGLAPICNDGKVQFIDKKGNLAFDKSFDGAKFFSEGLAPVYDEKKGFWGYIDRHGELVIPMIFDNAEAFEYGRAEIQLHGTMHYMNPNGECVKDCKGQPRTWKTASSSAY